MGVPLGRHWRSRSRTSCSASSFVVVTVKARVASLDPRLEEAAADLYANPTQTFLRVTFPLAAPGIAAACAARVRLSFDDYIVTNFTRPVLVTFPKYVWVSASAASPAQANVIGTFMFLAGPRRRRLVQVLTATPGAAARADAERHPKEAPRAHPGGRSRRRR